ncbi:EAL domain-containing protein [Nostocoides sp. Soil756]|jgi:diguanylate cyclase (GGDEF)-like protein/PAS domain S-box-containing protein|uniref:putative bifunctional diguanylate cyclase/phosphodiesterase n=1 Tax=Nostocoides sp. Soil756 TaxID=1736399 RepID=UPI000B33C124|nr:EAL domain-containing protein [Tetrasphaera sp. Soil756]
MARRGQTRLRTTATVAGTVLVVVLEMALLTGVWHLGDGLGRQREAVAALSGTLTTLTTIAPASGEAASIAVDRAVQAVVASGVDTAPGSAGAALVDGARAFRTDPSAPATLASLRRADTALTAELRSATGTRAWTAFALHAALLVIASLGWFVWFRRLVDRHREIEHRLTARQVVDQRERRLLALVQNSADLVVVVEPDGTASFVTPSAAAMLGRDPEAHTGRPLGHLLGEGAVEVLRMVGVGRHGDQAVRVRLVHQDGRELVAEGTVTNLLDEPAVAAWVLTLRDVTDQHSLAEELAHQAFHDSLTGLANRALFSDRLEHALRRRGSGTAAVLFWDLDDFKLVNDTHGHSVGDRLLVVVADRLRGAVRPSDTVARLGGDEFAVLMEDVDQDWAVTVAERVLVALAEPVEIDGTLWTVRASVGVTTSSTGEPSGEEMLRDADIAMYWAKEHGKGTVSVYDTARHAASLEVMALQNELLRAIDGGELVLHFQPTIDLASRAVTGFEALVRWQHPERGLLGPAEFIPAAERSGLVVPLGSWVLREACRAAVTMGEGEAEPSMGVNVSSQQLVRPGFVEEVAQVLRESGLCPQRLVLEVTESVLLDDFEAAERALNGLRAIGVSIAIDDFGTGYSSLSYLSQLPVDILKVDKSFIDRVCAEDHSASVTLAILEMSRSLRLQTVAEGVETLEQAAWLEERACGRGQGFLWSRPVPLADARALLLRPVEDVAVGGPEDDAADDAEAVTA